MIHWVLHLSGPPDFHADSDKLLPAAWLLHPALHCRCIKCPAQLLVCLHAAMTEALSLLSRQEYMRHSGLTQQMTTR